MRKASTFDAMLTRRVRGLFYGWWLVGAGSFMLTLMSVCVFQGMGAFLVSLERHFAWSRTQLSGAFSVARLEGALLGPLEGYLIDRLGSRRMITIGYALMGLGFLIFSQVDSLWQFYASYLVVSLGSGMGGWLAVISLVNNWFIRRRSFAMAAAMSGIHFGGFLMPVLALGLESHGFRWTTAGIGVFMLATVLPLGWFVVRNRPEEYGLRPDGDLPHSPTQEGETGDDAAEEEPDFTARQAMATPVFWILVVAHLSSTVSIVTLAIHLAPKLTDMGLTLTGAGFVILAYTAIALPAQFAAGLIADRFPKHLVMVVFMLLQATSMMIIAFAESVPMAYLFAAMYGIGFGGRVPLMTAIRGEYFGRKAFATIMGLSMLPNNIAMIVAPLFAGYMFDTTGTYVVPFMAFSLLNYFGAFLIFFVRKPKQAA